MRWIWLSHQQPCQHISMDKHHMVITTEFGFPIWDASIRRRWNKTGAVSVGHVVKTSKEGTNRALINVREISFVVVKVQSDEHNEDQAMEREAVWGDRHLITGFFHVLSGWQISLRTTMYLVCMIESRISYLSRFSKNKSTLTTIIAGVKWQVHHDLCNTILIIVNSESDEMKLWTMHAIHEFDLIVVTVRDLETARIN